MHNKLFIADNAFAVSGGRNIANEYFMRSAAANFIDMDVLSSGPVVRELSAVFDRYWNSEQVYPVGTLVATAPTRRGARASTTRAPLRRRRAGQPRDRLGRTASQQQFDSGRSTQHCAPRAGVGRRAGQGRRRRAARRRHRDGQHATDSLGAHPR